MSAEIVRRLNPEGIKRFSGHLDRMRRDRTLQPPRELLFDNVYTESVPGWPEVRRQSFATKRSAAEYIHQLFPPQDNPRIELDQGLWSWLALYFFESLCPVQNGKRAMKTDPSYILDPDYRRRYRQLLVTPYRILAAMPDHNRIFLDGPLDVHGEIIEQTISKLYMFRLPGVRAAIDKLYYDEERGRPKSGLFSTKEPKLGDLRQRFPIRIRQLKLTYDVAAIDADQLIELLGIEFSHFIKTARRPS